MKILFQNELLTEIISKYSENKLAHSYLIETNNLELLLNDLLILIQNLNCPNNYEPNCSKCNLCHLINNNTIPSLKIINPDGQFIKKNQIEELKLNFSTIPVYSRFNTYIINEADRLNQSSANAMLKFLEEPETSIIGFFLTTNKDIMLDTIKSRCQLLIINYHNEDFFTNLKIPLEELPKFKETTKTYLTKINSNIPINHKEEILNDYKEKESIIHILKLILEIYYHKYLSLLNKEYDETLLNIYNSNENISQIIKKMQIISNNLTNLSYNVNIELLLDKFVLEMRGQNG